MPQIDEYVIIDDRWLEEIIEHHGSTTELELALNLRDAREQLKTLKTYGEAKFAAETRLTELLTMAIEGLKLVADQNDAAYPKQVARTYLDRIKQKESST